MRTILDLNSQTKDTYRYCMQDDININKYLEISSIMFQLMKITDNRKQNKTIIIKKNWRIYFGWRICISNTNSDGIS